MDATQDPLQLLEVEIHPCYGQRGVVGLGELLLGCEVGCEPGVAGFVGFAEGGKVGGVEHGVSWAGGFGGAG